MKHLILALALCFSAVPAFAEAGNDGPNAAPKEIKAASDYIAQINVANGFVPHNHPSGISVGVKADGFVEVTRIWWGGKMQVEVIARLSKRTTAKLQANVNAVSKGKIVDTNPGAPECVDAPTVTYLANVNGALVKVEQRAGCKDFRKKEANQADYAVVSTLKALAALAELREPGKY